MIFNQCIYSSKFSIKYYFKELKPTPWKPAWIFSLVVLDWDSISFGGSTKTLLSSYKQNEWNMYHIQLTTNLHDVWPNSGTEQTTLAVIMTLKMFGKALPNYDALYYVCVCLCWSRFVCISMNYVNLGFLNPTNWPSLVISMFYIVWCYVLRSVYWEMSFRVATQQFFIIVIYM